MTLCVPAWSRRSAGLRAYPPARAGWAWAILLLLAAGVRASPSQQPSATAATGAARGDSPPQSPAAPSGAAILQRVPSDLPRGTAERWAGLFPALQANQLGDRLPQSAIDAIALAENCYRGRRFTDVLQLLYPVLESQPDLPVALQLVGTTYFRLRRYSDAKECFERFLVVAPEEIGRTQALGHCYYTLGDYPRAAAHYEQVLARLPDSTEAVRGLALTLGRLGERARSLELLGRVLAIEPKHSEALCARAQIYLDQGETELALADSRAAHESAPWEPRPLYLTIRGLRDLGAEEEADILELRWRELDSWAQAVRSLEDRVAYGRDVYASAGQLVELYQRTQNFDGLRRALDMVLASAPASTPRIDLYLYSLDAFEIAGDNEGALAAAEALERDFPEEAAAWKRLESFYGKRKDRKRQIEAGERYLRLAGD
jgi:tetratricopeptide (TPR) repeat protein